MKIFKLIIMKLSERPVVYLILAIQIYIAVYAINMSLGQLQYYRYPYNLINQSGLKDAAYLYIKADNISQEDIDSIISKLPDVKDMSSVKRMSLQFDKADEPIEAYMYDEFLLNALKLPLSRGEWDFNEDNGPIVNNVVISSSLAKYFKVEDEVALTVRDKGKEHRVTIKIAGILKSPGYVLAMRQGGDSPSLSYIFSEGKDLFISGRLRDSEGMYLDGVPAPGKILTMKDSNMEQQTILMWKENLRDIGWISTMREMAEEQEKIIKDKLTQQLVINFILFLLVVAGVGGNNILTTYRQMREYSLYYLCGAKWETCMLVSSAVNIIVILVPSIAAYLLLLLIDSLSSYSVMIIDFYNFICSLLFILIVYALSSILALIKLYRTSPVMALRRHE